MKSLGMDDQKWHVTFAPPCHLLPAARGGMGSQTISICERGSQNSYFKPNHETFLTLAKWLLCLNRAQTQWLDERETEHSTTQTEFKFILAIGLGGARGTSNGSLKPFELNFCRPWMFALQAFHANQNSFWGFSFWTQAVDAIRSDYIWMIRFSWQGQIRLKTDLLITR